MNAKSYFDSRMWGSGITRAIGIALIALALIAVLFGSALIGLYTDWLWFADVGYRSVFLRITPGAFGIAEGVQVFFATQFGADPTHILLAAILGRTIEVVCLALVSSVLVRRLARRIAAGNQRPAMHPIQT